MNRNVVERVSHCGRAVAGALGTGQWPCGCFAQTPRPPPKLTLKDAEALAIKNHPQILAAQSEVGYANQQVVETRSAYYPTVAADLTGSEANNGARIGAGFLTDSRLFNRFGQGITLSQLITDVGRTSNLVASSRFNAQASEQNSQATRYDVLLQVNRSYFDVLHAQSLVRVAEETVAARQLLFDQVSSLAKNNLRSQLDVSFADVNVSEAKLLLLRAQDSVQEAYAELSRALGSDQVVELSARRRAPAAQPAGQGRRPDRPGHDVTARNSPASGFPARRPTSSRRRKRTSRGQPSAWSGWPDTSRTSPNSPASPFPANTKAPP